MCTSAVMGNGSLLTENFDFEWKSYNFPGINGKFPFYALNIKNKNVPSKKDGNLPFQLRENGKYSVQFS